MSTDQFAGPLAADLAAFAAALEASATANKTTRTLVHPQGSEPLADPREGLP